MFIKNLIGIFVLFILYNISKSIHLYYLYKQHDINMKLTPIQNNNKKKLLLIGDSNVVGIGSKMRNLYHLFLPIYNIKVIGINGTKVINYENLTNYLFKYEKFDEIITVLGINDYIRGLLNYNFFTKKLILYLSELKSHSNNIYFLYTNISKFNNIPPLLKLIYNIRATKIHNILKTTCNKMGINFVYIHIPPKNHQSRDGYHLNQNGYLTIFNQFKDFITKKIK